MSFGTEFDSVIFIMFTFQNFYPAFEEHNAHVPYKCVLHESWDLYGVQEKSRYEDHSTKWRCELCGKAFYSSYHLDLHFDNRHTSELAKVGQYPRIGRGEPWYFIARPNRC